MSSEEGKPHTNGTSNGTNGTHTAEPSASSSSSSVEVAGEGSSTGSSSSAPATSTQELDKKYSDAKALFNEDKFSEAADLFADVLEAKIKAHGDMALECAEPYYLYGRSLFLQAKSESSVFGANAPKKQEEEEEEDDSDEEEQGPAEKSEAAEGDGKSIEKPEDVENLQVAWETLEVARLIYERYPEQAPRLSDVRYTLAEVFLETDNCNEAIEEFKRCITLREEIFPPHDRRIAEAHFYLGLSYFSIDQPQEAHFHYSKASDVLESYLNTLEPGSEEVEDIKSVLKDLAAKMEEVDPALLQKEAATNGAPAPEVNGKGKQASYLPKEEEGFAAPTLDPSKQPVHKFGVVGGTVKRATPVTTPFAAASASSSSAPSSSSSSSSAPASSSSRPALSTSSEKRKLEDIMGGEEGFEKRTKTTPDAPVCNVSSSSAST